MKEQDYPGWCRGICKKRSGDILRVLTEVVEAGLASGKASANDVKTQVSNSHCVGAAFKLLPSLGFVANGGFVPASDPKKHGRRVFIYVLANRYHAEQFVTACQAQLSTLMRQEPPPAQPMLPM